MKTIKVKINGIETEAEDRTPILNIAQKLGIKIPTLCHHPLLEPYGVCRICTVEVRSGKRIRMVTACNYPATNGIEVLTDSPRVRRDRKLITRMDDVPVRSRQSYRRPGGGIRDHRAAVRTRRRRLHSLRTVRPRLFRCCRGQCPRVLQPRGHAGGLDGLSAKPRTSALPAAPARYVCPTGCIQIEDDAATGSRGAAHSAR